MPEAELHVFYGFENWSKAARTRSNSAEELKKIDALEEGLKKPGVVYHGRVSQARLAMEQKSAMLWLYPTAFEETYCCLPGTPVSAFNGQVPIETLKVNDRVLTHNGVFRRVLKTMTHMVNEEVHHINVKYLIDDLVLTGNHRVLVTRRKSDSIHCVRLQNSPCTKRALKCQEGFKYKNKGKKYFTKAGCWKKHQPYEPEWLPVGMLQKGDYLMYPINRSLEIPDKFSDYSPDTLIGDSVVAVTVINKKLHVNRAHKIKDFELTPDFLRLCGWYVSEGCFDGRSTIIFSLNKKEKQVEEFIRDQLEKLGLNPWTVMTKTDGGMTVCGSSTILGRFLQENFGEGAHHKHLPKWIKDLAPEFLKHVLAGIFGGDGSKNKDTIVLESASKDLVTDLFEIMLKFGCVSSLSRQLKPKIIKTVENGKVLIKRGEKILLSYRFVCSITQNPDLFGFLGYGRITRKSTGMCALMDSCYVYLPIFKASTEDYSGPVFNLEVERDNSYVASQCIVHNCITAVECQRAGVPVLASNYAGLQTTVGDSGILLGDGSKWYAYSKEGRERFLDEAVSLLKDSVKWEEWFEEGPCEYGEVFVGEMCPSVAGTI